MFEYYERCGAAAQPVAWAAVPFSTVQLPPHVEQSVVPHCLLSMAYTVWWLWLPPSCVAFSAQASLWLPGLEVNQGLPCLPRQQLEQCCGLLLASGNESPAINIYLLPAAQQSPGEVSPSTPVNIWWAAFKRFWLHCRKGAGRWHPERSWALLPDLNKHAQKFLTMSGSGSFTHIHICVYVYVYINIVCVCTFECAYYIYTHIHTYSVWLLRLISFTVRKICIYLCMYIICVYKYTHIIHI